LFSMPNDKIPKRKVSVRSALTPIIDIDELEEDIVRDINKVQCSGDDSCKVPTGCWFYMRIPDPDGNGLPKRSLPDLVDEVGKPTYNRSHGLCKRPIGTEDCICSASL
jgi:hypothetical protein